MRLFLRIFPLALILLGASLLFEQRAYAYADPGTGLLAIQAVGSALVAAGWYLRKKIYSLFHRTAPAKPESPELSVQELSVPKDGEGSPLQ
jgi:O-antigen/teichoic acid export membrane protein